MKIRRLNESAEFNFNNAASSGNWPYTMSIETYVDIRDEISQIIDNLDQSCVFAIARDATKLGLNIDEERLYYSPIVTIENNISPEKINQFRSIVMRYSDEQLNEASNKKNENLTESISNPNVNLEVDGFDFEITDTFEDEGVTGYNVVYSKGGTPIVEIEIWEEDSPITVINNLFARNLFNRIYDSFDSFSADLIYKASKYCQITEEASRKYYIDEIVSAQGGKTETERHSFATIDELKKYCKDAGLTKDDIANCGGCELKDLLERLQESASFDELTDFFNWIQDYKDGALYDEFSAEFESVEDRDLDMDSILSWLESFDEEAYYDYIDKNESMNKDDIANCGVGDLCEDADKHIPRSRNSRVKLEVKYEVYGRYGTGGQVKKGRVSGADEVDALMNMLDHVHMYIDSNFADEFEEENGRRPTTEDVVESLDSQNGDGCDLIYYITNLTTGKMIFDGGISEEEEDWDDLDESADSKLYTKPNGEYLVKADSGKGYTAFSRDNVAIGGIDNEDADSDDKAIDKFKRNEYSERLNEEYFDTAEYRIQKYEDDIPELMAGMHDDYMEGKLDAARYAEVLKKVYDALAECDYKHTMSAPVVTNGSGKRVLDALDELDKTNEALGIGAGLALGGAAIGAGMIGSSLLDSVEDKNKEEEEVLTEGAEKCYAAKYTSVDSEGNKTQKKICFMCDGTIEDAEKLADELIKEPYTELNVIGSCLRGNAEDDGFVFVEGLIGDINVNLDASGSSVGFLGGTAGLTNEDVEDEYDDDYDTSYDDSLEECSGIKAHKVIIGEDIDDSIEFDDIDGVEGPEGDKTEDIEFVMDEYVSESLLIDFIEKVDPITYRVGANDHVVTVVFDPKWSEYVYTIDGKGPYSHSSYEFISRDIYDFVMSQTSVDYELDDLDEDLPRLQGVDLEDLGYQLKGELDEDKLGEDKWIDFYGDDVRKTSSGGTIMNFTAVGEDKELAGYMKESNNRLLVKFRNGSEKEFSVTDNVSDIARFIANEFGASL